MNVLKRGKMCDFSSDNQQVRNTEIRERCSLRKSLDQRVEETVQRWYRVLERERMKKRGEKTCMSECEGQRG